MRPSLRPASGFTTSIFTMRTRSFARTANCALMSCTLWPGRLRMVSAMAATMATSSSTAASSNGYAYFVYSTLPSSVVLL